MSALAVQTASKHDLFAALKARFEGESSRLLAPAERELLATGCAALDRALGGGFPRGIIGTLEGPPSSGRTSLVAALLAGATTRGLAAVIDDGWLYPPSLAAAGVRLDRMLAVPVNDVLKVARAADILLRSRAFEVVVMPAPSLRGAIWSRLIGLAHKSDALLLTVGGQAYTELAYLAGVRVACTIERVRWMGCFRELAGYDVCVRVLKHRRAAPGATTRIHVAARI